MSAPFPSLSILVKFPSILALDTSADDNVPSSFMSAFSKLTTTADTMAVFSTSSTFSTLTASSTLFSLTVAITSSLNLLVFAFTNSLNSERFIAESLFVSIFPKKGAIDVPSNSLDVSNSSPSEYNPVKLVSILPLDEAITKLEISVLINIDSESFFIINSIYLSAFCSKRDKTFQCKK
ncbi:hypothetical protein ALTERO38_70005 [Alteromonas sp. 38]|nr:hypothetical protein ALTERO38_70005 [Alteromonas sp. 38]